MPGGRPAVPTALKALQGTSRPDRANAAEPVASLLAADAPPPTWLGRGARTHWRKLLPLLHNLQVVSTADPYALALLCDALTEYLLARRQIAREGMTYETVSETGTVMIRAHPAVAIASDAWRRAKAMLAEFGLTPAGRTKVHALGAAVADPAEEWLNRAG